MEIFSKSNAKRAAMLSASMLFGAVAGGSAVAYQGHMWSALHDLQAAQTQLQEAAADKGGHRTAAMNLVEQAIGEVRAGIAVGAY